jgi:hypothetical protein
LLQTTSPSLGASTGWITPILPALGAAGVLTLSPGLHPSTVADQHTYHPAAITQSHERTIPAAPATVASRQRTTQTASTPPASRRYDPIHRITSHAPASGVPKATSKPSIAAPSTSPATRQTGPASMPPSTTNTPASTPPITVPPVNGVPVLPGPPISPPATIPSVSAPTVPVPSATIPSLGTATTHAPTAKLPSLG